MSGADLPWREQRDDEFWIALPRASIAGAALLSTTVFGPAPAAARDNVLPGRDAFRLPQRIHSGPRQGRVLPVQEQAAALRPRARLPSAAAKPRCRARRRESATASASGGAEHTLNRAAMRPCAGMRTAFSYLYRGQRLNRETDMPASHAILPTAFRQPLPAAALQALEPQVRRRVHAGARHHPVRRDAGVHTRCFAGASRAADRCCG